jgi:uncharacterized protein YyaL (SSP411 family)
VTTEKKHTNRLSSETSPYLLQHAHNPVDWYPWGPEALARARTEGRPILLSIGYAACHWCHVMERESFEDEALAAVMNEHFVCIKVDREERPDLDSIYMSATVAMNQGRGGWPMTVFLTPDGEPFFAGTYFPPQDRHGMPGFGRVLRRVAELWREQREALASQAREVADMLRAAGPPQAGTPGPHLLQRTLAHLEGEFDPTHGGFGPAPKFPHATTVSLLLKQARLRGDDTARKMAVDTLDGMAQGGLFDHIGGGFARYSTDAMWLVPHFEKMLYDNALLAQAYLEAFVATGEVRFAEVARATLDWVAREMTGPGGGFFASLDADSEGEEGKFYVWRPEEVEAVLGAEEARRLCAWFDISPHGNWEGNSIAHTPQPLAFVAHKLGISVEALRASIDAGRPKLYAARAKRVRPGLDDKILTAWNGLMMGAFATAARLLGEPRYLLQAQRAAAFVWRVLRRPDGQLLRTCRGERAHLDAYLEDYAYLAEGLLDLYEADGDPQTLERVRSLVDRILQDFLDPDSGAFFDTAAHHEKLLYRTREGHDGATPNANATAASVLARLSVHLDHPPYAERARAALMAYASGWERAPWAFCKATMAWQFLEEAPQELVLVGEPGSPDREALWRAVQAIYVPYSVIAQATGDAPSELPLLRGKTRVGDRAALYVCRHSTCSAPITDPATVASGLATAAG